MTNPANDFDDFDRKVADAIGEIRVPSQLRGQIKTALRSEIESPISSAIPWATPLLSVAAAILVALFVTIMLPQHLGEPSLTASATEFLNDGFQLDLVTSDMEAIKGFLAQNAGMPEMDMPGQLARMKAAGCRTVKIDGKSGALVCFKMPNGQVAHLFAFDSQNGEVPVGMRSASISKQGRWSAANWSEGKMEYLLFVPGSRSLTKSLLDAA